LTSGFAFSYFLETTLSWDSRIWWS